MSRPPRLSRPGSRMPFSGSNRRAFFFAGLPALVPRKAESGRFLLGERGRAFCGDRTRLCLKAPLQPTGSLVLAAVVLLALECFRFDGMREALAFRFKETSAAFRLRRLP